MSVVKELAISSAIFFFLPSGAAGLLPEIFAAISENSICTRLFKE